jgi:hypothetical protein
VQSVFLYVVAIAQSESSSLRRLRHAYFEAIKLSGPFSSAFSISYCTAKRWIDCFLGSLAMKYADWESSALPPFSYYSLYLPMT